MGLMAGPHVQAKPKPKPKPELSPEGARIGSKFAADRKSVV